MLNKLLLTIFTFLVTIINVAAQQHGGGSSITGISPNQSGFSPIIWGIFGGLVLLVGYFVYWLFSYLFLVA